MSRELLAVLDRIATACETIAENTTPAETPETPADPPAEGTGT